MKQLEAATLDYQDLPAWEATIREAVAFVELCTNLLMMREAVGKGTPLEEIVHWFSDAMDENRAEPQLQKVKVQVLLPEFRAYLAGRLGMMELQISGGATASPPRHERV